MFSKPSEKQIQDAYAAAKERYAGLGVDADQAMARLADVSLSLHCWQGDDVIGLENTGEGLSGGIAATGNYPGKARTGEELRKDLDQAYRLIPGRHRSLKGAAGEGIWAIDSDARGCLWVGGDLQRGAYSGDAATDWLGGYARFCAADANAPSTPGSFKVTS